MARTWTALYASVCTSKRLARVKKPDSQVFYFLLLTQCDAYGKAEDDAETLCARVWPLLGKSHKQTREAIDDLTQAGLLSKHAQDGATWLQIYAWDTHAGKHKGGSPGKSDYPDSCAANATSPVLPGSPRNSPDLPGGSGEKRGSILFSSPSPSTLPLPLDCKEFKDLWIRWRKFRTELRKGLTEEQERTQLAKLGMEGLFSATHRIERSIGNGWQGLWQDGDPAVFTPENISGQSKGNGRGRYEPEPVIYQDFDAILAEKRAKAAAAKNGTAQ